MAVLKILYIKNKCSFFKNHAMRDPSSGYTLSCVWSHLATHATEIILALHYLIFSSIFIFSFQGASYNQDRFNSSKSPIIMILKSKHRHSFSKILWGNESHFRSKSRKLGVQINTCFNDVKLYFSSYIWNCENHVPSVSSCFFYLILCLSANLFLLVAFSCRICPRLQSPSLLFSQ